MPIPGRPAARSESITPKVEAQFLTQSEQISSETSRTDPKGPDNIRQNRSRDTCGQQECFEVCVKSYAHAVSWRTVQRAKKRITFSTDLSRLTCDTRSRLSERRTSP